MLSSPDHIETDPAFTVKFDLFLHLAHQLIGNGISGKYHIISAIFILNIDYSILPFVVKAKYYMCIILTLVARVFAIYAAISFP